MKYVTVGFEKDGDADRFLDLTRSNGHMITFATKHDVVSPWRLHKIQAKTVHVWTPSSAAEARRFEVAGVIIEFADEGTAARFTEIAMGFVSGNYTLDEEVFNDVLDKIVVAMEHSSSVQAACELGQLLKSENIKGVMMER
jgi:hypothetical protein